MKTRTTIKIILVEQSYKQRRRLVCFLAVNGCPPGFIADWATAAPGYLRDQSAVQDVITLLTKWKTGTLREGDRLSAHPSDCCR